MAESLEAESRRYILAIRRSRVPPADWHERLARIPGVIVRATTRSGAHIDATPEGASRVQEEFSSDFHIEEPATRESQR